MSWNCLTHIFNWTKKITLKGVNIIGANSVIQKHDQALKIEFISGFLFFLSQTKSPYSLLWQGNLESRCPPCVFHSEIPRLTVTGAADEVAPCRFHAGIRGCLPATVPVQCGEALWLGPRAQQAAPSPPDPPHGGFLPYKCPRTAGLRALCSRSTFPVKLESLFLCQIIKHFG